MNETEKAVASGEVQTGLHREDIDQLPEYTLIEDAADSEYGGDLWLRRESFDSSGLTWHEIDGGDMARSASSFDRCLTPPFRVVSAPIPRKECQT